MLHDKTFIFSESITEYLARRRSFILNRLENINTDDHITIHFSKKNGRRKLDSIDLHIEDQKFKSYPTSDYSVKVKEKVYPLDEDHSYTKKFSYELSNDEDLNDFVRFDFYSYDNFPALHINAYEDSWGNHLTYPETTNINLECLDSLKALSLFEKFIHHPEEHILDQEHNEAYINIVEAK